MKISVENITIQDLSPRVNNPALQKYLPNRLFPHHISFELSPVSNAVSNAIRRTVSCELLVKRMYAEFESLKTDDVFIIPEMVLRRLRMIPIDQSCPQDAKFKLDVVNNTSQGRDVKSSEISIVGGKLRDLPFNGTFTLFRLNPGKSLEIADLSINSAYGYNPGDGMHALAVNAASVALDQKPINMYEPDDNGIPSSISNPRKYKISFTTNGDMSPKAIVVAACDNLIARVQSVRDLLYSITSNDDEYVLSIPGESHTIGNLFMRTILDLFPDIRAVIYSSANVGRVCTIRIKCDEDINNVFGTTIKHLVSIFGDIKRQFG